MKYVFATFLALIGLLELILRVSLVPLTLFLIIAFLADNGDDLLSFFKPYCWTIMERIVLP